MYYMYVLFEKTNHAATYMGYTSNLEKRVQTHNSGGNTSTRGKEWELVYYEAYISEHAARERERMLKHDGRVKRFLMERVRKQFKAI
jgi:putative endonuclease